MRFPHLPVSTLGNSITAVKELDSLEPMDCPYRIILTTKILHGQSWTIWMGIQSKSSIRLRTMAMEQIGNENNQPFAGNWPSWWMNDFNNSNWKTGRLPIGYDLGNIRTNKMRAKRKLELAVQKLEDDPLGAVGIHN